MRTRRVNVVGRIQRSRHLGSDVCQMQVVHRSPLQRRFGGTAPYWGGADAEQSQCDMRQSLAVELHAADCTTHGEITLPTGDLVDRPPATARPHRKLCRYQYLIRLHGRLPRRHEKVLGGNSSAAGWPGDFEGGVECQRR